MRLITALVLSALLGSCAPAPTLLEQVLKTGELRVVTRNSPTTFYLGAEEPLGIEYELARNLAERLGVKLRMYTRSEFQSLLPEVLNGKAHIAAAGLAVTEERGELVTFGPSYQTVTPQLVYRMGAKRPKSLADIMGGELEVVAGTMPVGLLEQARQRIPYLVWTERSGTSTEALLQRLVDGDIDFAIVASNEFRLFRHYYPRAQVAFDLAGETEVAWAMPHHDGSLREAVGAYFAEIRATGQLTEILDRNDYSAEEFDFVGSRAFVRHLSSRLVRYQNVFEQAGRETDVDWRLLAAIAYQESHWRDDAVSPTGVRGIMMLTERTATMMGVADRADPRESILGGARYFRRVLDKFPTRIPLDDRLMMAAAAYNIGFGHVEDARIITEIHDGNPDSWAEVRAHLPLLADEAWYSRVKRGYAPGAVPVQYVDNVDRYRTLLDWLAGTEVLSDSDVDETPMRTEPAALESEATG